jgi:hypothetical protein
MAEATEEAQIQAAHREWVAVAGGWVVGSNLPITTTTRVALPTHKQWPKDRDRGSRVDMEAAFNQIQEIRTHP